LQFLSKPSKRFESRPASAVRFRFFTKPAQPCSGSWLMQLKSEMSNKGFFLILQRWSSRYSGGADGGADGFPISGSDKSFSDKINEGYCLSYSVGIGIGFEAEADFDFWEFCFRKETGLTFFKISWRDLSVFFVDFSTSNVRIRWLKHLEK